MHKVDIYSEILNFFNRAEKVYLLAKVVQVMEKVLEETVKAVEVLRKAYPELHAK